MERGEPNIKHVDITLSLEEMKEGSKTILSHIRPNWTFDDLSFKIFTDGITNQLWGCFHESNPDDAILFRIYGNKTDLLIDRKAETRNFKLLESQGLAPKLYATINNGLVYEYLSGETLSTITCKSERIYPLVAELMARVHCVVDPSSSHEPSLWRKMMQFHALVPAEFTDSQKEARRNKTMTSKSALLNEITFLKNKLVPLKSRIVFCHNDLLLGNVIHNEKKDTVHFIDYEYSENNYQAFDIANHFCEFAGVETVDYNLLPDEAFQKQWLKFYWSQFKLNCDVNYKLSSDDEEIEKLYHQVEHFMLAAHLFWSLWSFVQTEHSTIDFDFNEYGHIRIKEYFRKKRILYNI